MDPKQSIDNQDTADCLIQKIRKQRNLTQKELAEFARVSFSFLNQVERGKKSVRLDTLNKLLFALGYHMMPVRIPRTRTDHQE